MSADSFDEFPYETAERKPSADARRHYWAVAIGLQEVDGLEVSPYLRELAHSYEQGHYTLQETGALIRAYHGRAGASSLSERRAGASEDDLATAATASDDTAEADLVSQRIAELLAAGSFTFAPSMLNVIHRTLFQDLDEKTYQPGQFKTDRLVKQEDILNGDSVLYADPNIVQTSLDYLFREEGRSQYGATLDVNDIERLSKFVALLWQVHPFVEGNTRTVAVFSELYLSSLDFAVGNEPFQKHARYYRDALVRANYRNNKASIIPDRRPLEAFYENLLLGAKNLLDREALLCSELFDNPQLLKNIDPSRALVQK